MDILQIMECILADLEEMKANEEEIKCNQAKEEAHLERMTAKAEAYLKKMEALLRLGPYGEVRSDRGVSRELEDRPGRNGDHGGYFRGEFGRNGGR
jgi:hypothetical protein